MISFKRRDKQKTVSLVLDTSGIIDGRIIAIAKAGFVPQQIIVPQFVVAELQHLADTGDSQKRERARFGLDVIRELQDLRRVEVVVAREKFKNIKEVDDKLVALAKELGAFLYTTDYNLNKVAQIEGVVVLNVNELAQAIRPPRLPGERVELKITQVGQDKSQGVGYLDDGTMVVVENAGRMVGQKIPVQFSRILQTQAGKMMFAIKQDGPVVHQAQTPRQQENNNHENRHNNNRHHGGNQNNSQNHPKPQQQPSWHSHTGPHSKRRQTPEDSLLAAIDQQS